MVRHATQAFPYSCAFVRVAPSCSPSQSYFKVHSGLVVELIQVDKPQQPWCPREVHAVAVAGVLHGVSGQWWGGWVGWGPSLFRFVCMHACVRAFVVGGSQSGDPRNGSGQQLRAVSMLWAQGGVRVAGLVPHVEVADSCHIQIARHVVQIEMAVHVAPQQPGRCGRTCSSRPPVPVRHAAVTRT